MTLPLTQQQAYYNSALTETRDNILLIARAGCGKTTTSLAGIQALAAKFPRAEMVYVAYNASIVRETKDKLAALGIHWKACSASTAHALGFERVKFVFNPEVDDKKVRRLIHAKAEMGGNAQDETVYARYGSQIEALVRYAKQAGVGFFPDVAIGDVSVWHGLADHFDVNGLDDTSESDAVVEAAKVIDRESLTQTSVIDFDDMILFPLIKNLRVRFPKDYIFVDEAQDLSRARQALIRKFLKPGTGRMIVVGDDRQAIYGFSGADAAALDNLARSIGARRMPLTVTWRCPKAVVALAQAYVPDLQAADAAPDGVVRDVAIPSPGKSLSEYDALMDSMGPTDAILCRNTAPLIKLAYKLIRAGKPCRVEGRSIGDGLITLAQRWKVKTINGFLARLDAYREREVQKAMAKMNEAKQQEVEDKCDTMREIAQACEMQGKTTVADMVAFINDLFADGATNVTVLATYHRSKGREWPRVVLYEHATRCPSRAARQPWQMTQEENLAYVAITRAQRELVFLG